MFKSKERKTGKSSLASTVKSLVTGQTQYGMLVGDRAQFGEWEVAGKGESEDYKCSQLFTEPQLWNGEERWKPVERNFPFFKF